YFRPNATGSRGEVFKIAAKAAGIEVVPNDKDDKKETTTGNVTASSVGSATAQYVPYNASSVKVGTLKLTADNKGDVRVTSVVISRSGLGEVRGIDSIQLAQNGLAVTDARSMSTSSQSTTLRFNTPLVLKAGTSVDLDVLASMVNPANNADALPYQNNQHQFTVTQVNTTSGTAAGTPVTLGLVNTTSYKVGAIDVNSLTKGALETGKSNQRFATIQLQASRDAKIHQVALTRKSGEDLTKVLANVKAYYNGKETGKVTVTNDKITVSDLNIERMSGETASIELRADGIYIGSNDKLTLTVESSTDVTATEKTTGYVMRTDVKSQPIELTLSKVSLNIVAKNSASKTVAPGTSNVEFFNADITSNTEFDISKFTVTNNGTGDFTAFNNGELKLWINGVDYDLTKNSTTFDRASERFTIEAGKTINVRITGNILSTATKNKDYKFTLSLQEARSTSGSNTMKLNRSYQGFTTTIDDGSFSITPVNSTAKTVQEGREVDLTSFTMYAASEDQTLQSLKLESAEKFNTFASSVSIVDKDGNIVKQVTDSDELDKTALTLEDLGVTLDKGVSTKLSVRVALKSGEVQNLGKKIKVSVEPTKVVKASDPDKLISVANKKVEGTEYAISAEVPSVKITEKSGNYTTVELQNTSPYDVKVTSVKYRLTRNESNNSNYLNWTGTTKFLDAINGNKVGNIANNAVPAEITVTDANIDLQYAPVTRVIEIASDKETITGKSYTVEITGITYEYTSRTDSSKKSASIEEKLSIRQ
ncbi:MAG: hypothetical protein ACTTH6_02925, partial [Candidatus Altimarinota bacterium]